MKIINTKSALWWMTVVVIVGSSALPLQAAIQNNFTTQETVNVDNDQLFSLSWGDIWDKLRRKKGRRGSRGPNQPILCMIAPGKLKDIKGEKQTLVVWSTQPLFIWQEDEKKIQGIEVRHIRSNKLMWRKSLKSKTPRITYKGEPLQPGEDYSWRETSPLEKPPSKRSFRIMNAKERQTVSAELKRLENKLKAKGASEDKITLAKVDYFADKQLWSDVLREMYAVKNSSPELKERIKQIESNNFCSLEKGEQKPSLMSGK